MQITLASHNDSEKLIKISKAYKATRDKEIQMIDLVNAILLKKFISNYVNDEVLRDFIYLCEEYKIKLVHSNSSK